MFINEGCQICGKPRTKAIYYWNQGASIWLLCDDCIKPSSKFSLVHTSNSDVTDKYDLDAIYLRDIHKGPGCHSGSYEKAFIFECDSGGIYMKVPTLWSDYHYQKVLELSTQEIVQMGHDTAIKVLNWDILNPNWFNTL